MKIADFTGQLTPNGQIDVPPEIAAQFPAGERLQVVIQWGVNSDDLAWRSSGRVQFENAYSPEDSIYEQLIHETPPR